MDESILFHDLCTCNLVGLAGDDAACGSPMLLSSELKLLLFETPVELKKLGENYGIPQLIQCHDMLFRHP
jgi:hypothetical protein